MDTKVLFLLLASVVGLNAQTSFIQNSGIGEVSDPFSYTNNLVVYYKMDEALSSDTRNDTWTGYHLSPVNSPDAGAGLIAGNSVNPESSSSEGLNRSDANVALLDFSGEANFTIGVVVQFESFTGADMAIVGKYDAVVGERSWELQYNVTLSRLCLLVSGDGTATTIIEANTLGVPSTGVTYRIFAWHDAVNNQAGIQVNGGTADVEAYSAGLQNSPEQFAVGYRASGRYWDGRIDELFITSDVLDSTERSAIDTRWQAGQTLY